MKLLMGDARKDMASLISSTSANLFSGVFSISFCIAGVAREEFSKGVAT